MELSYTQNLEDYHLSLAFAGRTSGTYIDVGAGYRTVRTRMVTLAQLCADHDLSEIDFLKIDVEGGEADVVHGGDWRRYRPKVVLIEAVMPGSGEPAWAEWET